MKFFFEFFFGVFFCFFWSLFFFKFFVRFFLVFYSFLKFFVVFFEFFEFLEFWELWCGFSEFGVWSSELGAWILVGAVLGAYAQCRKTEETLLSHALNLTFVLEHATLCDSSSRE